MLALSLCCLAVIAIAIYVSTKVEDEVFKVGMGFTALAFSLILLICAPWIVKILVQLPIILYLSSFPALPYPHNPPNP